MKTAELIEKLIAMAEPQDQLMRDLVEQLKEHHGAIEAVIGIEQHMLQVQNYRTSLIVEATVLHTMDALQKRRQARLAGLERALH
jgi:hypothetical protein